MVGLFDPFGSAVERLRSSGHPRAFCHACSQRHPHSRHGYRRAFCHPRRADLHRWSETQRYPARGCSKSGLAGTLYNTEILFAVGAGNQVVGRDDFSDYPEAAKAIGSIGGSNGKLNLEVIAQLQPDLVLASELNTAEQVKALEALKLNVYYLQNPTTLDELFTNLETVGKLTGREKEATDLVAQLQARVKAVDEKIAAAASQPKVFYELDATNPAKPYTAGPGTFINTLI